MSIFNKLKNMFSNDEQKNEEDNISMASGQYGGVMSQGEAAATDEMVEGMDLFKQAAKYNEGTPQRHGNLFEYIESAKFNSDAAQKGLNIRAEVTEQAGAGDPTAKVDINLKKGEEIVEEVQAKCYKSEAGALNELRKEDYEEMLKLVPKDKANKIKELARKRGASNSINAEDYRKLFGDIKGELNKNGASSGGTSYSEAKLADENPNLYANLLEGKKIVEEAGKAGMQAAKAGVVVGGGISAIKNAYSVSQGEKELGAAAKEIGKDAVKSGVRSGGIGASGSVVRYGAKKTGIKMLQKSNIATTVAAGTIEAGNTVYKFAKGEITGEETVQRLGKTGTSTASSIYTGAAAGMVFGPGGAAIGSVAGYIMASSVYQSCVAIFKEAELAEEEAARVIAMYEEARDQLKKQRQEFERLMEERLEVRKEKFASCFAIIDSGLNSGDPSETAEGLAEFANVFGKELKFETFEEFDEFMKNSDEQLTL